MKSKQNPNDITFQNTN
jgi:hypothetical protein